MKNFIHASMAFGMVAALAVAVPPGPGARTMSETAGARYTGTAPLQNVSANFTNILSTGFEAPDWQNNHSVCGDQFAFGVTCFFPVSNVCLFKNPIANQNCCPADEHNPAAGDPNPQTGWSMSPSGRHCRTPIVYDHHPFAGTQHLAFTYDALGGVPAGCSGAGSACRSRAITAQVRQPDISRAVWDMEISWDATLGSSMVQVIGMDTSVGSVNLTGYNYWYYLGYLLIYDFQNSGFVFGGYWSNYLGQYAHYQADYNPCNDTITYSYGGQVVHSETFGFHPPYGNDGGLAGPNGDTRDGSVADTTFYTTDHFPGSTTDIDNHYVTFTPCSDACCDGGTGTCADGVDQVDCSGPSSHWYPNVLCAQLGTDAKYPPACDRDTGACCDHSPLAGGPGPEGSCTDGVLPENCTGDQETWTKNAACAAVAGTCGFSIGDCAAAGFCSNPLPSIGAPCAADADCNAPGFCSAGKVGDYCASNADCNVPAATCLEDTGSCCDTLAGSCTDGVLFADCSGAQRIWTKNGECATVACDAVLGACCDADPFGSCTDTTSAGCTCDKCTWSKLQSCSTVECTHNSIPTVSEWGLVVLTLLLLTGAKVFFGRREAVA
jgi:hypothetical protein